MVAVAPLLAVRRLRMWKQDLSTSSADRIALLCSVSGDSDASLHYQGLTTREKGTGRPQLPRMEEDETVRVCRPDPQTVGPGTLSVPDSAAAVPSLSTDSASSVSAYSSLSLDTMWASGIVGNDILEDDGTGALVVPPSQALQPHTRPPSPPSPPLPRHQRLYICLFHILDCHDTFDDRDEWRTHVLSHFRTHEPPDTARCPLCPGERFTSTPDQRAWDLMLDHVDAAHYQQGQTLAGSRPDFELMQYLYRLRVISVDQFKVMQLAPPPSSPAYHRSQEPVRANIGSSDEPYCAPYSRRREERMRGQRRGVNVP